MNVTGGSTDVTTYFCLRLTADGSAATGLTIADLDLQYVRTRTAPVAKVDAVALAATDSAHTDNRAIEIDATDQPGLYRVDWPDAAFAAGAAEVILTVKHASCFIEHLRVSIDAPVNVTAISDDQDAASNLETMLDGTGGQTLNLGRLVVNETGGVGAPVAISGFLGGIAVSTTNGTALSLSSGNAGVGVAIQGADYAAGLTIASGAGGNGNGVTISGAGNGHGIQTTGGATGAGARIVGGGTSGRGVYVTTTDGHAVDLDPAGSGKMAVNLDGEVSAPAETAGRPTGLLGMIRRLWEGRHNKRTRDRSTGVKAIRNAADNANLETSTQSTASGVDTETQGA